MSSSVLQRAIHRVLTHPLIMAVKLPLKDVLWTARGRRLINPPVPASVRSMMFVCKGNICRSPFAAARARQLLLRRHMIGIACESAGLAATQAARPPREGCEAAAKFGLALDGHTPRQVTLDELARYDLIVVMEAAQLLEVRRSYPTLAGRTILLPLLRASASGQALYNIADPFGQPLAAFEVCYRETDEALGALIDAIAGVQSAPRRATGTEGRR